VPWLGGGRLEEDEVGGGDEATEGDWAEDEEA
jgi:hypothetical protein